MTPPLKSSRCARARSRMDLIAAYDSDGSDAADAPARPVAAAASSTVPQSAAHSRRTTTTPSRLSATPFSGMLFLPVAGDWPTLVYLEGAPTGRDSRAHHPHTHLSPHPVPLPSPPLPSQSRPPPTRTFSSTSAWPRTG
jgi:hypothetical protein